MSEVQTAEYGTGEVVCEVRIDAPRERVWAAITEDIGAWWHPDFFFGKGAKRFVVEATLGGRVYEDWGDGDGFVWYTVSGLRRGHLLRLSGELDLQHGPGHLIAQFRLTEDGDATVVRFTEETFGRATEKLAKSLDDGWRFLLGKCLKPYVEEGKTPEGPAELGG